MPGGVEGRPRVLGDAAVHHDEGSVRLTFHGKHPIEGRARKRDDRASRFDAQTRRRQPAPACAIEHVLLNCRNGCGHVEHRVGLFGVRLHAKPAAEHEPFDADSRFGKALGGIQQRRGVRDVGVSLTNLRADVCVQAGEVQLGVCTQDRERRRFVARVNAELRVVAAGPHEGMRAGFDADVQARDNAGTACAPRKVRQLCKLFDAVNDDVGDSAAASRVAVLQWSYRRRGALAAAAETRPARR